MNADAYADAKRRFEVVWSEIGRVVPDADLIDRAGELAEADGLRGYDAIHLSTALILHDRRPLYMLTWDADLADAAFAGGMNVIRTAGA